jgi:hypothetical protein
MDPEARMSERAARWPLSAIGRHFSSALEQMIRMIVP